LEVERSVFNLRSAATILTLILALSCIGWAGAPAPGRNSATAVQPFTETNEVLGWMFHYAERPEPARVPYAYMALSRNGSLRDPEQAGVYVGFLAGALRSAGPHADRLLVQLTALPHEDQWAVVRALAYSGLPDWQDLMRRLERHFPGRTDMAQAYLDGS